MKMQWLEKLSSEGRIRPEVLSSIYKDVTNTIKTADAMDQKLIEAAGKGVESAVVLGIAGSLLFGAKKIGDSFKNAKLKNEILSNRSTIAKLHGDDSPKAKARFDEMASIAPHISANLPLATKMISSKLHSGFTDYDVQSMAMIQSQYMKNVMDQKGLMPKTASVRPEVLGDIVGEVYLITKYAGIRSSGIASHLGRYVGIPLAIGAGAGLVGHAIGKMDQAKMKTQLDETFNKVISSANSEKDPLMQDREKARQAFNTLVHFAPQVALNPSSAKAFMNKLVSYDMNIDVNDIKSLSEIQKNLSGSSRNMSPFSQGFDIASKTINMPGLVSPAVEDALSWSPANTASSTLGV